MGNAVATHIVSVKTGMKKGASLDANVYIRLGDETGKWSKETRIDRLCKDDFESGNFDTFHLCLPNMTGRITELGIRRDSTGDRDEWYLHRVVVKNLETGERSYFPVNRWISANDQLRLSEFDCCLPSQDKYPHQRRRELERKKAIYQLIINKPGIPASVCLPLPHDEVFNASYQKFLEIPVVKLDGQALHSLNELANIYYFTKTHLPEGVIGWKLDESFGRQRLAGVNPVMIELCTKIPERFAVNVKMVEPLLEGKTLEEAMVLNKIYIENLSFLENLPCTDGNKLCSPFGLFYVKDCGDLVPIAIQIDAEPADDNPVFLPTDPEYTWLLAKMWLNLADASVHQSSSHLGLTHLLMESVVVCANRQLSPSHPIYRLLAPHFLYTIAINRLAMENLTSKGGWVDEVMKIGHVGMFEIIRRKWANWNLKEDGNLLKSLRKRGVDDEAALPNYHYRDDAKLLWNAISEYVAEIVNHVYGDSDEKLLNDYEIQSFASELSSSDGAAIQGAPAAFTTTADLKEILTILIFTSSAQHAAVNFGQYDEYAFSPNYPTSIRTERPKTKAVLSEEDILAALPTKEQMVKVIRMVELMSNSSMKSLSHFEMEYSRDPSSKQALMRFKQNLRVVGEIIDKRNKSRAEKYMHLHPHHVPNSISI